MSANIVKTSTPAAPLAIARDLLNAHYALAAALRAAVQNLPRDDTRRIIASGLAGDMAMAAFEAGLALERCRLGIQSVPAESPKKI